MAKISSIAEQTLKNVANPQDAAKKIKESVPAKDVAVIADWHTFFASALSELLELNVAPPATETQRDMAVIVGFATVQDAPFQVMLAVLRQCKPEDVAVAAVSLIRSAEPQKSRELLEATAKHHKALAQALGNE